MAEVTAPPSPLELLWQAPLISGVVLAGEGLALLLALAPGFAGDRAVHFGLASLMIQWVSLLTLGGLYVMRGPLARQSTHRVAWVALSLMIVCTWLTGASAWWLWHATSPRGVVEPLLPFMLRLTALALIVGLLGLAAFQNLWRARRMAVLAKQSELEALQARIRPHFLFNTLNTAAALVHARPGEAEQLLLDLADLFRAALSGPREISLADELSLVRRYLEIESLRFGPRLRLGWDLPAEIPDVLVPALSIQPLAENAIRHGVEPSANGANVDVSVRVANGMLRVAVANDLPRTGAVPAPGHQVGQASARERIDALSEGRGRLETRIEDGRYTATILLPLA